MNKSVVYSTNPKNNEALERKMTQYLQNYQNPKIPHNSQNCKYGQTIQYSQNALNSQIASNNFKIIENSAEKDRNELFKVLDSSQIIGEELHSKITSQISGSLVFNQYIETNGKMGISSTNENSAISGSSKFINSISNVNKSLCVNTTNFNRGRDESWYNEKNRTRLSNQKPDILNKSTTIFTSYSKDQQDLNFHKEMKNSKDNKDLIELKGMNDFKDFKELKELKEVQNIKEDDIKSYLGSQNQVI